MGYALAADTVLLLHALFILTVGLGGFMALRWPAFVLVHLPAACWGVYVSLSGHVCPLTGLEQYLRHAAGQHGYAGGFIDHYLLAFIYPDGLTRSMQMAISVGGLPSHTEIATLNDSDCDNLPHCNCYLITFLV